MWGCRARDGRARPFGWTKHWYAVAAADDVEKDRPYAFTLLDQPLVIWHDGSEWRCAEDRCPHRAAPLSEGKASSTEAEASACGNRRSCATMRPIRECMSLLFVWGDSGPGAAAEAAAAQPPLLGEWEGQQAEGVHIKTLFKPDKVKHGMFDMRRLEGKSQPFLAGPTGTFDQDTWQCFISFATPTSPGRCRIVSQTVSTYTKEPLPLVIASLFPQWFEHVMIRHKILDGDRDKVKHGMFDMRRLEGKSQPFLAGPTGTFDQVELLPPSTIAYKRTKPDDTWQCFISFATPTSPGRCRIVSQTVSTYTKEPLPLVIASLFPQWFEHVMIRHKILDGDSIFLHLQEHKLVDEARQLEAEASAGGSNGASASTPDTAAAVARAWQRCAGGALRPSDAVGSPQQPSKSLTLPQMVPPKHS
eukprot:scaffold9.g3314.t1